MRILTGGQFGITFQGLPGVTYQIQRSSDLTTWETIGTHTPGADGKLGHTEATPLPAHVFYRISKP